MTTAMKRKSSADLIKASEALFYEVSMLNTCAQTMVACSRNGILDSQFTRNTIIESFCVHLRNIIEFFGREKNDYIAYTHFVTPGRSYVSPYKKLRKRYNAKINNLLSHLTFQRLQLAEKDKQWDLPSITNEVNENIIQFLHVADSSLLCDNMRTYQKQLSHEETRQDNTLLSTTSDIISSATIVSDHRGPTTFRRRW